MYCSKRKPSHVWQVSVDCTKPVGADGQTYKSTMHAKQMLPGPQYKLCLFLYRLELKVRAEK